MEEQKEFTCEKMLLREKLKIVRADVNDRLQKEKMIMERVLPILHGNVMVYATIGSEVSTKDIICELNRRGVSVYVPFTVDGNIIVRKLIKYGTADRMGNFPIECYGNELRADKLDYCITPALCVNTRGFRLGYGKGCYDKFFSNGGGGIRVGLAFDCQMIDFAEEKHDIPLDCCVTEKRVVYFNYESNIR